MRHPDATQAELTEEASWHITLVRVPEVPEKDLPLPWPWFGSPSGKLDGFIAGNVGFRNTEAEAQEILRWIAAAGGTATYRHLPARLSLLEDGHPGAPDATGILRPICNGWRTRPESANCPVCRSE